MAVIRLIATLIHAILQACVSAFLAISSLAVSVLLGVLVIAAIVLVSLFGVGGLRAGLRRRRSGDRHS